MNMKIVILLFATLAISLGHNMIEECDCGAGYHINPDQNLCIADPIAGETGYIENCSTYEMKLNDSNQYQLNCSRCLPTHAPNVSN